MKILRDECVDWRLSRDIVGHDVSVARDMGWTTVKNGELLKLAAEQFDAFITVDRIYRSSRISHRCRSPSSFCTQRRPGWPI